MEDEEWNWEDVKKMNSTSKEPNINFFCSDTKAQNIDDWQNVMTDDNPIRGTRLLSDVYQRCNIAVCEPADFEEAKMDQNWIAAMKEELLMIERNKTWELVD